ncbi:hypothetical protein [uncultured Ligilactobacillus sp.]|uniref:hypothetical protein n=1 Tax=uncultured Ligilactobacillus sp. TaxID=2837633 RepID=UPI00272DAB49|nr:hypothetical protein [uncultured Ligilactobacillus sp.]
MNELEKMLLAAILKQGVKEEDTNKEQKKEAVKQAGEVLKKADLDFAVLASSENTDYVATNVKASSLGLFVMLNELFENMHKNDLECIKSIVYAEINSRDKED